jgi:hypothetical protein
MSDTKRSTHPLLIAAMLALLAALLRLRRRWRQEFGEGPDHRDRWQRGHRARRQQRRPQDHADPTTEIKKKEGLAAVRYDRMQASSLMPGLPIVADLVAAGDAQNATAISFRSDDFRTAQQVQAGVAPTSTKVDAMGKRMDDFGKLEAVAQAEVTFASGSTALSEKGKSDLMALAQKARTCRTTWSSCRATRTPPATPPPTSA